MNFIKKDSPLSLLILVIGNCLFALIILALVYFQAISHRRQIIKDNADQVTNMSIAFEEAINSSITSIEIILRQIAYDAKKYQLPANIPKADLLEYKSQIMKIPSININWADANGILKWNSESGLADKSSPQIDILNRSYYKFFKENNSDKVLISEPLYGKIRKQWVIVISIGLRDKNGKFIGLAWCSFTEEYFQKLKGKLTLNKNDVLVIASGDNPLYFYRYPPAPAFIGKPLQLDQQVLPVLHHQFHRGTYEVKSLVDGRKRITAFSWVDHHQLFLIIGRDLNTVLADWRLQSISMLIFTIFANLMSIMLTIIYYINNKQYRHFQMHLANAAKLSAVGEMAGGIAHEINNPLAIISTKCAYLKKLLKKEMLDMVLINKTLQEIDNTVERITKIILGLKTVARDSSEEQFMPTKIRDIMEDAIHLCAEKMKNNGVDFIYDLENEFYDQIILCKRVQISQVFLNLLSNAFDATEDLPERWVKIECHKHNDIYEFRIMDSGKGVSKEVKEKMFQPFFTTKPVGKGTGLGLSLSMSIIKEHGGHFYIDNDSQFTCFVITLPVGLRQT